MKNYVIYRVACTIQLLIFFFLAVFIFHPRAYDEIHSRLPDHPYVYNLTGTGGMNKTSGFRMTPREEGLTIPPEFNLPVIALVVIVILNDATIISIAYDHVIPSPLPEKWNLPVLFIVAGWIGIVACGSSLLLLGLALDSENPDSWIRTFGFRTSLSYGQVVAIMYLKISLSDWWTIFAARTQGPFWVRSPSPIVAGAAAFATFFSTLFSIVWPFQDIRFNADAWRKDPIDGDGKNLDIQIVGLNTEHVIFCWIYTIFWFLVQDVCKVLMYKLLFAFDVCGIQTDKNANDERVLKNKEIKATFEDQKREKLVIEAVKAEVTKQLETRALLGGNGAAH
jgi:H+-transporting ATPase